MTDEEEEFETFDGSYRIGGRIVRDWKPLGPLTFAGVIQRSSNIGTLQVADRLGSETLHGYLQAFGFGEPTGFALQRGESGHRSGEGRLAADPARDRFLRSGDRRHAGPTRSGGVNAVATGGVRLPLQLIRGIGGEVQPAEDGLQVISPMTAARVGQLLAGAVLEGTGGNAAVDGFSIAGKTGTAQKAEAGGYSDTDYTASFAGFAPARNPLFTGVVILDVQRPNHSGAGAAAVFGRIADRVLWHHRRTGWGTERLVSSGRGGRHLAGRRRGRIASAPWGSKAAAGYRAPARDLVASRVRMAERSDPATSETTLIAGAAGTPSGSPEPPVRSAIPESLPSGAPGSPEGGSAPDGSAAGPDRETGAPSPQEPSVGTHGSRPQ